MDVKDGFFINSEGKEERNYRADSEVDKFNLDSEWDTIASVYMYWAEKYIEARTIRAEIDEELRTKIKLGKIGLDKIRSEVDLDIRSKPEEYGFDKKPTENAISALIDLDEEYIKEVDKFNDEVGKLQNKLNRMMRIEGILEEAKKSMKIKKEAIEGLETLHLANYFPRTSGERKKNLDEVKEKQGKEIQKKLDNKIKRRKEKE